MDLGPGDSARRIKPGLDLFECQCAIVNSGDGRSRLLGFLAPDKGGDKQETGSETILIQWVRL